MSEKLMEHVETPVVDRFDYDLGWKKKWSDVTKFGPSRRHVWRLVKKITKGLIFDSIMDIGCGTETRLSTFLKENTRPIQVVGVDISKEALERAKTCIPSATFHQLDIEKEQLDFQCDLTLCCDILEHLAEDEKALMNIRQMTRKYLIVATLQGEMGRDDFRVGHVRNYTKPDLFSKLDRSGFRILRFYEWGFPFFSPLHRRLLNLFPAQIVEGKFGLFRRFLSFCLYLLFHCNSYRHGDYLIVLCEVKDFAGPFSNRGGDGKQNARSFYDRYWPSHIPDPSQTASYVFSLLPTAHFKNVLDAGCGTGVCSLALSQRSDRVSAVDLSLGSLRTAKALAHHHQRNNIFFGQVDLLDLPFQGGTFDLVYCWGVLHHTTDPIRGLDELVRVLSPQGTLILALYLKTPWRFLHEATRWICLRLPSFLKSLFVTLASGIVYLAERLGKNYQERDDTWIRAQVIDWFFVPVKHFFSIEEVESLFKARGLSFEVLSEKTGRFRASSNFVVSGRKKRKAIHSANMNILGIAIQHDAGAALVRDGQLVAAANEERFKRKKLYWGVPEKSIEEVLRLGGLRPSEIDGVVISNLMTSRARLDSFESFQKDQLTVLLQKGSGLGPMRWLLGTDSGIRLSRGVAKRFIMQDGFSPLYGLLESFEFRCPVTRFEHHDAHAASAYFTSGWPRCLVVTCDAVGDGYCSKVFVGEEGRLRLIQRIPFLHSPGNYYSYVTRICGFREGHHEGKITGLAAFGNWEKTLPIFQREIAYDTERFSFVNRGLYMWPEIERLKKLLEGCSPEDMAAGVQKHLEDLVTAYIDDAIKKTGIDKVVLAGGVFANVKLNQRVRDIEGVKGVFIHPHMGDGGLASGAALATWAEQALAQGIKADPYELTDVFLGPEFDEETIEKAVKNAGAPYRYCRDIDETVADLLSQGKVVARMNGRMEYGPRALGNRSILYQATDKTVNDWLNKKLKRTEFMPFAPILQESDASQFLKECDDRSRHAAVFMTITYDVTDRCKKEAPAIVHVDGTARPQLVTPENQPSLHRILELYKKKTGLSVLINTSFNMHEEPIVCSPEDAIRAFQQGHLDTLAIGNFLLENSNAR